MDGMPLPSKDVQSRNFKRNLTSCQASKRKSRIKTRQGLLLPQSAVAAEQPTKGLHAKQIDVYHLCTCSQAVRDANAA